MSKPEVEMKTSVYRIAAVIGLALALVLGALVPAALAGDDGPRTVHVSGSQTPLKNPLNFDVTGDLVGTWYTLSVVPTTTKPTLEVFTGNEVFKGCLDRRGDGKCGRRDLSGTLTFDYIAWESYDAAHNLIKGQCTHPVTGGTGDFAGSRGVISIHDTPVGDEVKSVYRGDIELNAVPSEKSAADAAAAAEVATNASATAPDASTAQLAHACGGK